jgi:hypothetical protein
MQNLWFFQCIFLKFLIFRNFKVKQENKFIAVMIDY